MKAVLALSLILGFSGVPSTIFGAETSHMKKVHKAMRFGTFSKAYLPKDYTSKQLYRRPKMKDALKTYLKNLEAQKAKQFAKFVMTSEEYEDDSLEERKEKAANPNRELEVQYLVQIEEIHEIFYKGESVGYVYKTADHVEAAIIQDGAGIDLFVDEEMNVIAAEEWQA